MYKELLTYENQKEFALMQFAYQNKHGKIIIKDKGNKVLEQGNISVQCLCPESMGGGFYGIIFYDYHCSIVNYQTGKSSPVYKEYALWLYKKLLQAKGQEAAKQYLQDFEKHWAAGKLAQEEKIRQKAEKEIEHLNKQYEENCLLSNEKIEEILL